MRIRLFGPYPCNSRFTEKLSRPECEIGLIYMHQKLVDGVNSHPKKGCAGNASRIQTCEPKLDTADHLEAETCGCSVQVGLSQLFASSLKENRHEVRFSGSLSLSAFLVGLMLPFEGR